jgi:hypothetical protein
VREWFFGLFGGKRKKQLLTIWRFVANQITTLLGVNQKG